MLHLSIDKLLESKKLPTLIDVRSPGEFAKGHMPSAKNLPLFSDEERAIVGTLYKQQNAKVATMKGLDLAGKKMSNLVKLAEELIPGKSLAIHCWRGGMRSQSIATLLEFMGYEVELLTGGYKAYRNFVLQGLNDVNLPLVILGGKTGSGKTEILHCLREMGEQIIDLEGLANHRGSTFGALGQEEQPRGEQFENDLFEAIRQLDPQRRVWVENESRSIGKVVIPAGFWGKMRTATLLEIDVPFELRAQRSLSEYGHFNESEIIECLEKITKRMGGQNVKAAREAFAEGDLKTATELALRYYDRTYEHSTSKKEFAAKHLIDLTTADSKIIAENVLAFANENIKIGI